MTHASLPLVLEDGSRLDWPEGRYEPSVRVASDRASISHGLAGAPSLEWAIDEGIAKWAAEIRCPKTLLSRVELSSEPTHTVRWRRDELDGVSWIVPGLLAVQEFELNGLRNSIRSGRARPCVSLLVGGWRGAPSARSTPWRSPCFGSGRLRSWRTAECRWNPSAEAASSDS